MCFYCACCNVTRFLVSSFLSKNRLLMYEPFLFLGRYSIMLLRYYSLHLTERVYDFVQSDFDVFFFSFVLFFGTR